MTLKELRAYTVKELTQLARKHGLTGISSLNKEQLVRKLASALRRRGRTSAKKRSSASRATSSSRSKSSSASSARKRSSSSSPAKSKSSRRSPQRNGTPSRSSPAVARRIKQFHLECRQRRELAGVSDNGRGADQVMLSVLDSYWLRVQWNISTEKVRRAQAALAQQWHSSVPVLRLLEIGDRSTTNTTETVLRDIRIHGGVNCWFIDVDNPPRTFRVDLGYLAPSGKFFVLARSNVVTTPARQSRPANDSAWEYQMGSQRLDPAQAPAPRRVSDAIGEFVPVRKGALPPGEETFPFELDAELVVHGWTAPGAQVTLQGEEIPLRPDGSFTVRFAMPNARQVIPAVATSPDGARQQTIVLAVERNTKVLEPLVRESHS